MASLTIVVADDDENLLQTLAHLFRLDGHVVHTARDGAEALAICRTEHPDSALLDIDMPKLTGWQVAEALSAGVPAQKPSRLVALSGRSSREDRARSQAAGFDAHCTKPTSAEELLRLLGG
jgi:CheY-like chemotaxis protein